MGPPCTSLAANLRSAGRRSTTPDCIQRISSQRTAPQNCRRDNLLGTPSRGTDPPKSRSRRVPSAPRSPETRSRGRYPAKLLKTADSRGLTTATECRYGVCHRWEQRFTRPRAAGLKSCRNTQPHRSNDTRPEARHGTRCVETWKEKKEHDTEGRHLQDDDTTKRCWTHWCVTLCWETWEAWCVFAWYGNWREPIAEARNEDCKMYTMRPTGIFEGEHKGRDTSLTVFCVRGCDQNTTRSRSVDSPTPEGGEPRCSETMMPLSVLEFSMPQRMVTRRLQQQPSTETVTLSSSAQTTPTAANRLSGGEKVF